MASGSAAFDPEDLDDLESCTPGAVGEVTVGHAERPERRRHRIVVRTLAGAVGRELSVRLKNGKALHGTLVEFDSESEVGRLGDQVLIAAQVHDVDVTRDR